MGMVTGRRLNRFMNKLRDKVLRTTEELEANTEEGYIADALLVKEINGGLKLLSDVKTTGITAASGCPISGMHIMHIGKLLVFNVRINPTKDISAGATVATFNNVNAIFNTPLVAGNLDFRMINSIIVTRSNLTSGTTYDIAGAVIVRENSFA